MEGSFIRLGANHDGGYVVPDVLDGVGGLISPGIGDSWTFESDVLELGIPCLLIDGSIEKPFDLDERLIWLGKMLGARSAGERISLADAVDSSGFHGDLILQMDIEGGEFSSLLSCPASVLNRFRVIILEVHRLSEMTNRNGVEVLRTLLECLGENHVLVHTHENSQCGSFAIGLDRVPDVAELTFVRSDWFRSGLPLPDPTELDYSN